MSAPLTEDQPISTTVPAKVVKAKYKCKAVPHQRTSLFVRKSDGMYSGMTNWQAEAGSIDANLFNEMERSGDYNVIDLFTPVGEGVPPIHGVLLR